LLSKRDIDTKDINGYDFEVTTHMMVASSVAGGTVDCGLGVRSAAEIFDLDFIPIGFEDYDFIILKSALHTTQIKSFISVLKSDRFKEVLLTLGGYQLGDIEVIEREEDVMYEGPI